MNKIRLVWALVLIGVAAIAFAGYLFLSHAATTVVLVRHAEKADASPNTNLSAAGMARAEALVAVVDEAGLTAAYTTDLCRTAQTAQPAAQTLGLSIFVQQTGSPAAGLSGCSPAIGLTTSALPASVSSSQDLADHLLARHRSQAVLVVGHSNTVPEIIAALGHGDFDPITITEPEFDGLFVVIVPRFFGAPRLVKATYGG